MNASPEKSAGAAAGGASTLVKGQSAPRYGYRVRFAKTGDLRLISHRDLLRLLERLFRRAGIGLSMSEGFHPKPRYRVTAALALGVAGLNEVLELDLAEPLDAAELLASLRGQAPPGLSFHTAEPLPPLYRAAVAQRLHYELPVPAQRQAAAVEAVKQLLAGGAAEMATPAALTPDKLALVEHLQIDGGVLHATLCAGQQAGLRPRDLLAALGLDDLETYGSYLTRTGVELESEMTETTFESPKVCHDVDVAAASTVSGES